MSKQEFKQNIIDTYNMALKEGQEVEVNHRLIYININRRDGEYYFSDQEAEDFINEYNAYIENGTLDQDITIEQWLLWQAQGW